MSLRRIAFLTAWVVLLSGCTHMAKARQCRNLARTVNGALSQIAALKVADEEEPAALRKAAARYAQLAGEVKRARPTHDAELGRTVDELASLFRQTADALGELADAKQSKHRDKAILARRQVDNLGRSERTQARRVDSLCNAQ